MKRIIAAVLATAALVTIPAVSASADEDTVTPTPVGTVYTHREPAFVSVLVQPYYIGAAIPTPVTLPF